jgi:hypothetical protein
VRYGCGGGCTGESLSRADDHDYDEEDRLEASKNVEEYFANYGQEGEVGEGEEVNMEDKVLEENAEEEEELEDDEEFEKL